MTSASTSLCDPGHYVRPGNADRRPTRAERRNGCGRIAVVRARGRSVVRSVYATSPLRLLTPKNHGHGAWIYASSYGGGLVDGDAIAIQATVGIGAMAFLSTQSATKVYRSPHGTEVELHAEVGENGLLISAPDAVVCFAGARYRQTQRVNLAAGAGLILLDWMTSGRRESGDCVCGDPASPGRDFGAAHHGGSHRPETGGDAVGHLRLGQAVGILGIGAGHPANRAADHLLPKAHSGPSRPLITAGERGSGGRTMKTPH